MSMRKEDPVKEADRKESDERTSNDFNEELMSPDHMGGPVETEPVTPDSVEKPQKDPKFIPGVASS